MNSPLLPLAMLLGMSPAFAAESARHNDMDGDGRSDLIWGNANTGAIVYWSGASAGLARRVLVDKLAYNVGAYDPTAVRPVLAYSDDMGAVSGRTVLQVRQTHGGAEFTLFPRDDSPGYSAYASSGYAHWQAAGAGDFDGNGTADLFYRNQRDGRNYILRDASWGDWAGINPAATVADLGWRIEGIGDFDGDDRSDVLWRNARTGSNVIWRSADAASRQPVAAVTNLDWEIVAVGDFNGDGRSDLLWRNSRTGTNVVWRSGNHLTRQAVSGVANLSWRVVGAGDFNGDGTWDVAWRNFATGANVIWHSANSRTPRALPSVALAWSVVM